MTTKKVNGQKVEEKTDAPANGRIEPSWLHLRMAASSKATDADYGPGAEIFWLALRFTDGRVILLRTSAAEPDPVVFRVPHATADTSRPFTLSGKQRDEIKLSVDAYADLNAGLVAREAEAKLRDARGRKAGAK